MSFPFPCCSTLFSVVHTLVAPLGLCRMPRLRLLHSRSCRLRSLSLLLLVFLRSSSSLVSKVLVWFVCKKLGMSAMLRGLAVLPLMPGGIPPFLPLLLLFVRAVSPEATAVPPSCGGRCLAVPAPVSLPSHVAHTPMHRAVAFSTAAFSVVSVYGHAQKPDLPWMHHVLSQVDSPSKAVFVIGDWNWKPAHDNALAQRVEGFRAYPHYCGPNCHHSCSGQCPGQCFLHELLAWHSSSRCRGLFVQHRRSCGYTGRKVSEVCCFLLAQPFCHCF